MDLTTFYKILILFSLIPALTYAQENISANKDTVYQLEDVVISANRYETSSLKTASSVTVINSEEIALSKKNNVADLLQNEYGISFIESGGPGKLTTTNLRGASGSHTLILIDGVEMNMPNDPGSVYDFSNLPLNNIKRIEILRGPQSTLYGSEAMAGVINIFTTDPVPGTNYFINAEGGTYNTYSGSAGMSGILDNFDYRFSLSGMQTDGFSSASERFGNTEKDGAENKLGSGRIGYRINDNLKINLLTRFTKASADYDQFGGESGDDPTYIFKLEETTIRPEVHFFTGNWHQVIGFAFYRNLRKYSFDSTLAYGSFSNSFYDGKKYKIDWLNNIRLSDQVNYVIGVDIEKESAVSEYNEFNSTRSFQSSFPQNEMNTTGMFVQNSIEAVRNSFFSWGIRYDKHNKFGSIVTYRLASSYFIESTSTKLKVTYGTGFKTPSLFNLFDPNFGNINLKPEKSTGWDIGFEQFLINGKANFGAAYFSTDFEDLFGFDESFRTININEAETKGVETFASFNAVENLSFKLNYTYTRSRDKNPLLDETERALLRRPEHKGGVSISFRPLETASLNLEVIRYGSRSDKDFSKFPAERINLDPFTLVNFAVSYKLLRSLELYTRFENLLDEEYEQIYGYASAGFGIYGGFKLDI